MSPEPTDRITLRADMMDGTDCVEISAEANTVGEVADLFRRFLIACGYPICDVSYTFLKTQPIDFDYPNQPEKDFK